MFWVSNRYARIWKVFRQEDKYVDLSINTSEKKQDGTYENSSWNARLIGKAFNQYKKGDIQEGKDYAIRGKLTNVRYEGDDGKWHDSYRLLVMETGPAGKDIEGSDAPAPATKAAAPRTTTKSTKPAQPAPADEEEDPF